MGASNLYFGTARRLILIGVAALIPRVLGSHDDLQSGNTNNKRRYIEAQYELAIPKIPSEGQLPMSTSRPVVALPSSNEHLFTPSSQQFETSSNPPYYDTLKLVDEDFSPLSEVADSIEGKPANMLVMGYYPDWLGPTFSPNKINFTHFDWIDFAFAVPDADLTLKWDDPGAPTLLQQLVTAAHSAGTKVKLSIGGWTGSKHFSVVVASNTSRSTFVDNIVSTYMSFDLDGIDIDWEYPGRNGASGNHFKHSDSANFLSFLQLLRAKLPSNARISAAVETTTFTGTKGKPMVDLSGFAAVLDWVLIMNYDVWGSSRNPGPNAPLHDACNNSTQPDANAVAAYNAWTSANFPAQKLVLGLPSYGYISSSTAERLRTRSKTKTVSTKEDPFVTVVSADGGSDRQIQFRELIDQGALVRSTDGTDGATPSSPVFLASGGFERRWDSCSDTPYLRSASSGQIVTYDDPESLGMKAAFAKGVDMLGVNLFDIHGDNDEWDLMNAVRNAVKN